MFQVKPLSFICFILDYFVQFQLLNIHKVFWEEKAHISEYSGGKNLPLLDSEFIPKLFPKDYCHKEN